MSTATSDSRRAETPDGGMTADLAFTDLGEPKGLAGIDADSFRAGQVAAVISNVPAMVVANAIAAGLLFWFSRATPAFAPLTLWVGAMLVASAVAGLVALRMDPGRATRRTIDAITVWAVLFGVMWALVPIVCLLGERSSLCLLVAGIAMAAGGLGACGLARVPSAALLFVGILTSTIAVSSQVLDGRIAIALLVFAATYGVALAAMILGAHRMALLRAADAAELERQREIIQLLLRDFEAGASDWLWETGPEGDLVYVSDRLAQVLGRDQDQLIGSKLHQAVGMSQSASGWRALAVLMARRQPVCDLEVPVRRKGKTVWWQLNARPLHDASCAYRGYRGVGSDITARRQAAVQVLRAKESAERASAAKSRFLAMMSHELRTPLNAIVGFSEIIAGQREGPIGHAKYADYARSIHEGSRHLAALISDILDVSRFESGSATLVEQEVDLVEVAEVAVKMCRGAARAGDVVLVEDFAVDTLDVRGEATRLQQIMINLVSNAVKFTPAGGTVRVTLGRDQRGGVEFVVSDTGVGISSHDLKRVFEPFVQAEDGNARRFGGIGLGLAISRSLARLHDGDVVIASRPGKGTVARLVLPPSRLTPRRPSRASAAA
jgi:two-component system, sensor histidine kinase